jgi:hypothetical protein
MGSKLIGKRFLLLAQFINLVLSQVKAVMLSIPPRSTTVSHVSFQYSGSASIYLPITCTVIAEMKKPVLRIMPFTASWTFQITGPPGSLAVVILRNGKCCPATARDEKHFKLLGFVLSHRFGCCCEYTVGRWLRKMGSCRKKRHVSAPCCWLRRWISCDSNLCWSPKPC